MVYDLSRVHRSIDIFVCTARYIRHVIHAFVSWQSTCQSKQRKEHVTSWWWFAFLEFLYVCFRFRLFILEQDRDYSTLATHIHILRTSIISFLGGISDIREIANRLWDEADEQELGELGAIFLRSCPSLGSLINHWDMSGWPHYRSSSAAASSQVHGSDMEWELFTFQDFERSRTFQFDLDDHHNPRESASTVIAVRRLELRNWSTHCNVIKISNKTVHDMRRYSDENW